MSNSVSPSKLKFLRDENVKRRLEIFLLQNGFDVITLSKKIPDEILAQTSKSEKRIIVTNDLDFTKFSGNEIFSVILLRIPQEKPESLIDSFSTLLKQKSKHKDFEGKLIVLFEDHFDEYPLC
jgi:predicted nuclease of predicted toxin-antitoxin system